MKINCLQPVFLPLAVRSGYFGKSALFANAIFELLPQLSFGIARGQLVWRKVALEVLRSL